jgi:hypothetical protein
LKNFSNATGLEFTLTSPWDLAGELTSGPTASYIVFLIGNVKRKGDPNHGAKYSGN